MSIQPLPIPRVAFFETSCSRGIGRDIEAGIFRPINYVSYFWSGISYGNENAGKEKGRGEDEIRGRCDQEVSAGDHSGSRGAQGDIPG